MPPKLNIIHRKALPSPVVPRVRSNQKDLEARAIASIGEGIVSGITSYYNSKGQSDSTRNSVIGTALTKGMRNYFNNATEAERVEPDFLERGREKVLGQVQEAHGQEAVQDYIGSVGGAKAWELSVNQDYDPKLIDTAEDIVGKTRNLGRTERFNLLNAMKKGFTNVEAFNNFYDNIARQNEGDKRIREAALRIIPEGKRESVETLSNVKGVLDNMFDDDNAGTAPYDFVQNAIRNGYVSHEDGQRLLKDFAKKSVDRTKAINDRNNLIYTRESHAFNVQLGNLRNAMIDAQEEPNITRRSQKMNQIDKGIRAMLGNPNIAPRDKQAVAEETGRWRTAFQRGQFQGLLDNVARGSMTRQAALGWASNDLRQGNINLEQYNKLREAFNVPVEISEAITTGMNTFITKAKGEWSLEEEKVHSASLLSALAMENFNKNLDRLHSQLGKTKYSRDDAQALLQGHPGLGAAFSNFIEDQGVKVSDDDFMNFIHGKPVSDELSTEIGKKITEMDSLIEGAPLRLKEALDIQRLLLDNIKSYYAPRRASGDFFKGTEDRTVGEGEPKSGEDQKFIPDGGKGWRDYINMISN